MRRPVVPALICSLTQPARERSGEPFLVVSPSAGEGSFVFYFIIPFYLSSVFCLVCPFVYLSVCSLFDYAKVSFFGIIFPPTDESSSSVPTPVCSSLLWICVDARFRVQQQHPPTTRPITTLPFPPPHQQLLAADATQESVMCICCRCGSLSIPAAVNRNMSRLPSAHATSCAAELGLVSVFCTCSGYMYAGR